MVTRFEVVEATIDNNKLMLKINDVDQLDLHTITDGERILMDTENLAFIYLLESNNEFIHVSIGVSIWAKLKEAIDEKLVVTICVGHQEITLKEIIQELTPLVENIKGNSNYGDETVRKVEEIF